MNSVSRRTVIAAGGSALLLGSLPDAAAGQKKPPRGRALLSRGEPEWYSGQELAFIGMPVGGFFAGAVYLGGDGQLWNWDIFNAQTLGCVQREDVLFMGDRLNAVGGANYVDPVHQQSPFAQRVDLYVGDRKVRFGDLRFRGEYPVGRVVYGEADADVEMSLEAFSPFCPLDVENSSFPATTMTYRVRNVGKALLKLRLAYAVDNPVLVHSRKTRADFELRGDITATGGIQFSAAAKGPLTEPRASIPFEDWSSGTYHGWKSTGTAFGDKPRKASELPSYMGSVEADTEYVVNTHQTRNGEDVVKADTHVGTLISPAFTISRKFINMRVGGGNHMGGTCVNLLVDGAVVASVTGRNSNVMRWESVAVEAYEGRQATLQVVDQVTGGWGQIALGRIEFSDQPRTSEPLEQAGDFGTFCVDLVGGGTVFHRDANHAEIGRSFELAPGASQTVTFIVAWHFPNCRRDLPGKKHWYASRWSDAAAVARDLIARWKDLQATTLRWNRTWYDSTLPYWFLDRTFVNTSTLATTTCYRLDQGRFYFWEGVGCCAGTCTHVWGYAQAIGRLFPEVERFLRKEIDFGIAYRKDTGAIDYRAEYHQIVAVDGQASCILRAYREHLMSKDMSFLRTTWPQIKGAMQYLIQHDANRDGILDGAQYNTLDTAWFGEIAWISSLYLAALRSCEAMATEMNDSAFAQECKKLCESGAKRMEASLFNGEYFFNRIDPQHPEANNSNLGCHVDQIYGQSWALQVGLPRVVNPAFAQKALKSLFKYNFYEDVWKYRRENKSIPGGRWYANPKEAGLIMCSFPNGGADQAAGKSGDAWAVGYFNECMSGFEYQAAAHMIAEGLLEEGLTIISAIHDRYHASKRNPYNEVECSDHYGRALASYGAFISMTGFYCHGPKREMRFSPKPKGDFKCAFVNERGWGTYSKIGGEEKVEYAYEQR